MATSKAPIQNGHIAEAIATHALGPTAEWIGGRNKGFDVKFDGSRIDVKSGVRQNSRMSSGGDPEECIGIFLNSGLAGLAKQEVDELVIVVRDGYGDSSSSVTLKGANAEVELKVQLKNVAVYRLAVEDVMKIFKRPFIKNGSLAASTRKVDARLVDIEKVAERLTLD